MADSDSMFLAAEGAQVRVSPPTEADIEPYRVAMERSARRIGVWNPVNPTDLAHHVRTQSNTHRTFVIRALDPRSPDAPLVGSVNVSNVVQGRFMSATMGYNAFDPYVGTGLFGEGLQLVVGIALSDAPVGMGLHRVEANVRIGNSASAGVLRSLGFRRERTVRRMLWLADGLGGPSAWRDHDSYAITRDEWPAAPYGDQEFSQGVLVLGARAHEPLAVALARELGATALVGLPFDGAYPVARYSGAPVVWCAGDDATRAVEQLQADGVRAARIDQEVDGAVARGGSPDRYVVHAALAVRPYLS